MTKPNNSKRRHDIPNPWSDKKRHNSPAPAVPKFGGRNFRSYAKITLATRVTFLDDLHEQKTETTEAMPLVRDGPQAE